MFRSVYLRSAVLYLMMLNLIACSIGKTRDAATDVVNSSETNTETEAGRDTKKSWFQKLGHTPEVEEKNETTIWEALRDFKPEQVTKVNEYIWRAALEVLDFLPVRVVDPFSGVIVTDYGTPPGGNRAYRASIFISDPALDARALKLSLQTKSGPASISTQRAIEESILTRARQLRKQADSF